MDRLRERFAAACLFANGLSTRAFHRTFRFGIATRLGIAFVAVAILAIAANFLVRHKVTLGQTQAQSAAAAVRSAAQSSAKILQLERDALLASVGRLERAVLVHTESGNAASAALLQRAESDFESASAAYLLRIEPDAGTRRHEELSRHVARFLKQDRALVHLSGQRLQLWGEYWQQFELLDTRLRVARDRAFRLFGRVFAHQSLLVLSQNLEQMREQFRGFANAGVHGRSAIERVLAGERKFEAALAENERALSRTYGAQWLSLLRAEFASIAEARAAILSADEARASRIVALMREATQLRALVSATQTAPPATLRPASSATPATAPLAMADEPDSSAPAFDERSRALIAWISIVVLALLLLVSVRTVLSQTQLEARVEERTRQLQHLAEHDPLTQLPNRRQLFAHLQATLQRAARDGKRVGVFFLDLDNFKNINDSMGHAFGDRVLQEIGRRLSSTMSSFGFTARLGGDEFTAIQEGIGTIGEIHTAGAALVAAFQQPLHIDGRELLIGISVGASVYPDHGTEAESLLRAADAALFRAKALGRSQLSLFSPELLDEAAEKFSIEQGLRRAIERGEFEMVYQPEICVETREVSIVEALLRWRRPDGRHVSPTEFLAVAEQSGLIMDISDWVLCSAIAAAARWHRGAWPGVRVAINVSSRQLLDERFAQRVVDLLRENNLPAQCVEFELTENVLQTGAATIEALRRLREHGVSIALDDFGTGYSSLASLQQLPLTRVKLDRSLIASIDTSRRSAAIARAIVGLCQNLGLEVTAEGVERLEQLAALTPYKSINLQGYLLSKPLHQTAVEHFLPRASAYLEHLLLSMPESPKLKILKPRLPEESASNSYRRTRRRVRPW